MARMIRRIVVVPIALTALALAAAPAGAATDAEIAEAGVITDTDFTGASGRWFRSANEDSSEATQKLAKKIKSCKDYVSFAKSFATSTDAVSPEYEGNFQLLSNHSYVYKSDAAAEKAYKKAAAPGISDCLEALMTKQFEEQLKADPQSAAQIDKYRAAIDEVPAVNDAVGDRSVGYAGGLEWTATDGSVDGRQVTTLVTRVGRAILSYSYSFAPNNGQPEVFDAVLANTVARSQAAQG